ncbi:nucleoprotein [megalopteran chu-related virus 119]|uniref:Nucleoprotein n=1 Tax=megalopteran chu-related virus 119 TaxID=2847847 RepID=A0A7U3S1T5_9VIRU|nr:nucleoprotein [megalopteran chu-related virus 119]QPB73985.1 nucleoprotein [megalopteran chu-related virus 119]
MSSISSWKRMINERRKLEKKRLEEDLAAGRPVDYIVPLGWQIALQKESIPQYYYGFRHKYIGIHLDKQRDAELFASRDIVLSYIFAHGLNSFFKSSQVTDPKILYVKELVTDIAGWTSTYNIEHHLYSILRAGITKLISINPQWIEESTVTEHFSIPAIQRVTQEHSYYTAQTIFGCIKKITDGLVESTSHEEVDSLILYYSYAALPNLGCDLGFGVMIFVICFKKMGNIVSETVDKRITSFDANSRGRSTIWLSDFDASEFRELYEIINYHMVKGNTTVDRIVAGLKSIMVYIDNVAVTPLVNHIAYSGLTALHAVTQALSHYTTFPWNAIWRKNPMLRAEMAKFKSMMTLVSEDVYIGYRGSGAAANIAHMAYLSIQLLIVVGGQTSLNNYKGVGSKESPLVFNKEYYDGLIMRFKQDIQSQAGTYEELVALEKSLKNVLEKTGVSSLIAGFLSQARDPDDDDTPGAAGAGDEFFADSASDNDSDHDDKKPPKPRGKKSGAGHKPKPAPKRGRGPSDDDDPPPSPRRRFRITADVQDGTQTSKTDLHSLGESEPSAADQTPKDTGEASSQRDSAESESMDEDALIADINKKTQSDKMTEEQRLALNQEIFNTFVNEANKRKIRKDPALKLKNLKLGEMKHAGYVVFSIQIKGKKFEYAPGMPVSQLNKELNSLMRRQTSEGLAPETGNLYALLKTLKDLRSITCEVADVNDPVN